MNNSYIFASQQIADLTKRVNSGTTTSVLGVPGAGITLFLRHLADQLSEEVIYLDVFSLPSFKTNEFYKALLGKLGGKTQSKTTEELVSDCKKQVELLAKTNDKVIICIAGFDQLQPEFSAVFFHYLRSIRAVNPSKVVFIFGICRRLDTLLPTDLINADISLFSSVYYLKPYSNEDMTYLLSTYGPHTGLNEREVRRLIELSGGHFQFLQLLLNSERRNDPVQDPFIQLAFKNIFLHLSTTQKAIVRKLVMDGTYKKPDDYLTNIGIIKQNGNKYTLFSELFADCVRAFSAPKLPIKERRLLTILKRNEGKIVPKREIYDAVWKGQEIGSEWALNALVYRLRKHPAFTTQNYTIVNHKKLGYSLTKNN
jgi:hypothetical protein